MKKRFFGAIASLLISVAAMAQSGVSTYELDVKEFDQLKVVDGINVEYFCDTQRAGKVQFDATPTQASAIIFEPNGKGKLEVKLAVRDAGYTHLPVVRVYSSFLSKVENDGDSTVRVMSLKSGPKLDVKLIGNGHIVVNGIDTSRLSTSSSAGNGSITLSGQCSFAKLSITGTGQINAYDLLAKDAEAKLIGTGWIKCNVTDNLKVTGMGTGTVTFKGNPITTVKALKLKVKRCE